MTTTPSNTVTVNNLDWQTVESVADITMTEGKTYVISIENRGKIKIANAEFPVKNEKFPFTQCQNTLYIKSIDSAYPVVLTIYENEN